MKKILEYLFDHQYLTSSEAHKILGQISEGKYNVHEISAFLTVFRMRNISIEELKGFKDCLSERFSALQ